MRAEIYFIPETQVGRLAIMPRPRAGDWLADEIASWRQAGLDVVVSLLEAEEIAELELADESKEAANHGIQFIHFPIPDRSIPADRKGFLTLVDRIADKLATAHNNVGIHCRIGVGRSALLAACVLVRLGMTPDAAWTAIGRARGMSVPDTQVQRDWVATTVSCR